MEQNESKTQLKQLPFTLKCHHTFQLQQLQLWLQDQSYCPVCFLKIISAQQIKTINSKLFKKILKNKTQPNNKITKIQIKPYFQIFVKLVNGKTITLDMLKTDRPEDIYTKLSQKTGYQQNRESARLVWCGQDIYRFNHLTLKQLGLRRETTVHVIYRLR